MERVVEIITGRERRRRWGVAEKLSLVADVKSRAILALAQSWCKQRLYSGCESVTEMTHRGVINLGRKNHTCAICAGRRRGFDGSRSDHDTGKPKGKILLLSRLPTTVGQRSQPL